MASKQIVFDDAARKELLDGLDTLANAVKVNVEADNGLVNPLATGCTIVHVFEFRDMNPQGVSVGKDKTGFTPTCGSNLNIADNALVGE